MSKNGKLGALPFDPELTPGARNAVNICLRILPSEKVTVIADAACREIAASLVREIEQVGAKYRAFVLEEITTRPMADMPPIILDDMESSDVSIYAVQAQANVSAGRQRLNAGETGHGAGQGEERENVVDAAKVGADGDHARGEDRLDFTAEQEPVAAARPVQRADAEAITGQDKTLLPAIP